MCICIWAYNSICVYLFVYITNWIPCSLITLSFYYAAVQATIGMLKSHTHTHTSRAGGHDSDPCIAVRVQTHKKRPRDMLVCDVLRYKVLWRSVSAHEVLSQRQLKENR